MGVSMKVWVGVWKYWCEYESIGVSMEVSVWKIKVKVKDKVKRK